MPKYTDDFVRDIEEEVRSRVMTAAKQTQVDLSDRMVDLKNNVLSTYYSLYTPKYYNRIYELQVAMDVISKLEFLDDGYGSVYFNYGVKFGPNDDESEDYGYASRMNHRFGKKSSYDEEIILINFANGRHGAVQVDPKHLRARTIMDQVLDATDNEIEDIFNNNFE